MNKRSRYRWLAALPLLLAIVTVSTSFHRPKPVSPNIVLFYMDDLGYGDVSCNGALGYSTPNIDQLAAEGTRFTNYLAAQAVCTASRASLLTGCYPNRLGLSGAIGPNAKVGINASEETLAELLRQRGYRTGIFGKWHLGHLEPFLPLQHGFDEFVGIPYSHDMWPQHPNQANAQYPPLPLIEGNRTVRTLQKAGEQNELTTLFTQRAVSFIRANKKNPFFLYVPHPLPHVPLGVSPRFAGKSGQGLFADVMLELDWSVGEIMKTLREQGLDRNTLVIFTSDNGPWLNYGEHAGSPGGFREGKATTYEGGHRVPCLMRWPASIPAGRVCNKLITSMDLLPTIADLCGAPLPKQRIDGVNAAALLRGDHTADPRTQFYYYYRRNNLEAVRQGQWKLVLPHPGRSYVGIGMGKDGQPKPAPENHPEPLGLYNLSHDPGERYDLQQDYPDKVTELQRLAEAARSDLGDDLQQRQGAGIRPTGQVD